mgnify:CR=1 FL=1|tara:strand:+ start:264 stop:560 length:297 start_codon:yes stop_codon:yes gene_type:complete
MADKIENPTTGDVAGLSPEEVIAKRAEITKYYEDHIPALETQLQYETLLRDIEKTRAERLQAQMFITKSMAEPPAAPSAPVAKPEIKRPLKKKENATK